MTEPIRTMPTKTLTLGEAAATINRTFKNCGNEMSATMRENFIQVILGRVDDAEMLMFASRFPERYPCLSWIYESTQKKEMKK
jgi:hypothetical protein